ncbi:MAG: SHOCT domain-containing protein [Haloplanus sp.]
MSSKHTADDLFRLALIVLAVAVLSPVVMLLFAAPMMGMGMLSGWGGGMMGGYSPLWGLGTLAIWFVVLAGIGYALYRGFVGSGVEPASRDDAIEELRLAYARGDLSDEEFEQRREKLRRDEDAES